MSKNNVIGLRHLLPKNRNELSKGLASQLEVFKEPSNKAAGLTSHKPIGSEDLEKRFSKLGVWPSVSAARKESLR